MRPITIPDDASTDKPAKQALMRRQLSYVDQARTIWGRRRGVEIVCVTIRKSNGQYVGI